MLTSTPSHSHMRTCAIAYCAIVKAGAQFALTRNLDASAMLDHAARLFRNSEVCAGIPSSVFEDVHAVAQRSARLIR